MQKRILLAEDHPLLRGSIRAIFDSIESSDLQEVGTCRELLQELKRKKYTHLILDLTLADGNVMEVLDDILHNYGELRILVYSSLPAGFYGALLRKQFGIPYLSKSEPAPQTINQLLKFLRNDMPVNDRASEARQSSLSALTQRETQVLPYLLLGWSAQKIGEKFDISPATVRVLKRNILEKTNSASLIELARIHHIG